MRSQRIAEIEQYIYAHKTVTLDDLSEKFFLSKPYLSKYIKEKSGKTFSEHITLTRLKRAKALLRNGNMTIENVAYSVGYPNVEHFNRTFKKRFGITPGQYRQGSSK